MDFNESVLTILRLVKDQKELLEALNSAIYSKASHVSAVIDGVTYAIPSFLSLENKIDTLEANLKNIVDAPKTGEAFTYFDGTTQRLELSGYATTPKQLQVFPQDKDDKDIISFRVNDNNIFKDFMTPSPYIRISLGELPANIKSVNVKKVVLKNSALRDRVKELTKDGNISWAELKKVLYIYKREEDYVEYDTLKRLPLKDNAAYGEYTIKKIINHDINSNLEEFYTIELCNDLKKNAKDTDNLVYYTHEGTLQHDFQEGDFLTSNEDRMQLRIEHINKNNSQVEVKVMYGGYANLGDENSNNPLLHHIRYYKPLEIQNENKVVSVALEEDPIICIFVAPINDTTNVQGAWGDGLYIDTFNLQIPDPENPKAKIAFKDWYDKNVNNIGDALYSITSMMSDDSMIDKLSKDEFDNLSKFKPTIDAKQLTVTQINKHLNDSASVKEIRRLYNQKAQYKTELDNIQNSIDSINTTLANTSFDDTSNLRELYTTQLDELVAQRSEKNAAINTINTEISASANASDTPIENAKYRIRGFIPIALNSDMRANIIKVIVEYRYKNRNKFEGNAISIGSNIFSDWNIMKNDFRKLKPKYEHGRFIYELEDSNEEKNVLSFNQIDIPITQGEVVDIRVKYVYDLGYPFAELTSEWSDVFTQSFPTEFLANIEILDILAEAADEMKSYKFTNILESKGIIKHAEDSVQDQTITYFHQPEHIASGSYTPERRVISLLDKLKSMDVIINDLQNEIQGAISDNLQVTLTDSNNTIELQPDILNTFHAQSYTTNPNKTQINIQKPTGEELVDIAFSNINLHLYNKGNYIIKIHTMFPGDYNTVLDNESGSSNTKFDYRDYVTSSKISQNGSYKTNGGVYFQLDENSRDYQLSTNNNPQATNGMTYYSMQRLNQILYFRTQLDTIEFYKNPGTDIEIEDKIAENGVKYSMSPQWNDKNIIIPHRIDAIDASKWSDLKCNRMAYVFPYPGQLSTICIKNGESFIALAPGESLNIPLSFYYYLSTPNAQNIQGNKILPSTRVTRTIAFDIRTSLFRDPATYKVNIEASHTDNMSFTVKSKDNLSTRNQIVYRTGIPTNQITARPIVK